MTLPLEAERDTEMAAPQREESTRHHLYVFAGLALLLLAVLALTGLGNYYLTWDAARAANSLVHQGAGLLAIVPALVHWVVAKRADSSSVAGR